jgi:hypothetical protein
VRSIHHETEEPHYIKIWKGQRYVTCRCWDCGRDFYVEEPFPRPEEAFLLDDSTIDDEDELRAAEEDLRRQADDGSSAFS